MFLVAPALAHLIPEFWPETTLEVRLSTDPSIFAGLAWGAPRPGHPEGTVATHVAAMLRRIPPDDPDRAALRALAIVHDAAKMAVRRDDAWSPDNDHAVLARRLAEAHTDDPRLLTAIELHDEPYWRWRHDRSDASVDSVLERVADPALFVRFVELDASTEGKDLSFLWWNSSARSSWAAACSSAAAIASSSFLTPWRTSRTGSCVATAPSIGIESMICSTVPSSIPSCSARRSVFSSASVPCCATTSGRGTSSDDVGCQPS